MRSMGRFDALRCYSGASANRLPYVRHISNILPEEGSLYVMRLISRQSYGTKKAEKGPA
jgi:hypothetical protein